MNGINFKYTLNGNSLKVTYTDAQGNTVTRTGTQDELKSIFTDNNYTEEQAQQILFDLFNGASYDKDSDGELTELEINEAFAAAGADDPAGATGPSGTPTSGGSPVDGAGTPTDVVTPGPNGNPNAKETEKNQYWNKSNADVAAAQGEAKTNYDTSKEAMGTAKTGVDEAKDAFTTTQTEQDGLVKAAEDHLAELTQDKDQIKNEYGEAVANALEDVQAKQTAEDEAQTRVSDATTAVADSTAAVADATTALDTANASLTEAQAALDSAPMFVPTGETDSEGNPILKPNDQLAALQEAVTAAEEAVQQAEEALNQAKEDLAAKEEELQQAETALDEAKTARNESQQAYDEAVQASGKAEDENLKAISEAVKAVSDAQDNRTTAINEAKQAVTTATTTLKEASETFKNNQQALHDVDREVNTRKAKGIWDASNDKTPEEIAAEEQEAADKTEDTEEAADGEEAEEGEEADGEEAEEVPDKGQATDLQHAANNDMVTYAMVKDELNLAKENNVNLKDYIYAKGQDGVFHLYNASTGKSIAREYGAQRESQLGLNVWGGGFDIVGQGSGYLKDSTSGDFKTVYRYGEEADTVIAQEQQYNTSSPLSFDLDGNGVGTTNEMISYDIDGDGKMDNIFNSADAVLVFDKDGDGISGEDGSECFGDNTDLDGDGKADGYKDGFEALKALAAKDHLIGGNDRTLDDNDLAFLEKKYGLKIKANGYNSEAVSLAQLGISNINLANTNKTSMESNFDGKGNELMHQEGATFEINGQKREYADLWHRKFNNRNFKFLG